MTSSTAPTMAPEPHDSCGSALGMKAGLFWYSATLTAAPGPPSKVRLAELLQMGAEALDAPGHLWPGRAPPAIGGLGRVCAAPRPPRGAHRAPQSARGTDPPRELCSARDARGAAARAAHAGAARPLGEHVPRDALAGARGRGLPGGGAACAPRRYLSPWTWLPV